MPCIKIETIIEAPIELCFDLSRSIDLHKISTKDSGEEAIAGVVKGLIGLDDTVTWRAKHLGIWQHMTTKITALEFPIYFTDEMVEGAFKSFKHEHHFLKTGKATLMTDLFDYSSPLGVLGKIADTLFLKAYMKNLLIRRNQIIKYYAESELWEEVLKNHHQP